MDDLISRQAAIDAFTGILQVPDIETGNRVRDFLEVIVGRIKAIPSAQPEQRWIPVSEKLPEEGRCVLVTVHPDYIAPDCLAVEKLNYYNGEWVSYDGERLEKFPDPIIAWMPLPDPYKEEE